MINDFLLSLGLDAWRPLLSAVLLPPMPFLFLTLCGAGLLRRRPAWGWLLVGLGSVLVWLSHTTAFSQMLRVTLLPPVQALSQKEVRELKGATSTAIVVLGGGRTLRAPEYGVADLRPLGIERLRYGLWLARESGLPVLFSGGVAHGAPQGPTEAEIAARVAERDFRQPLRWIETTSHDTRENAMHSVALLRSQGIQRIVVVTHYFHMARAMGNFERAVAQPGTPMRLIAAPMAVVPYFPPRLSDFVPTRSGALETSYVLHEWLGRLGGA
jgi:uncharacterized SAM-binding protein YcdF (DUF218 family)